MINMITFENRQKTRIMRELESGTLTLEKLEKKLGLPKIPTTSIRGRISELNKIDLVESTLDGYGCAHYSITNAGRRHLLDSVKKQQPFEGYS